MALMGCAVTTKSAIGVARSQQIPNVDALEEERGALIGRVFDSSVPHGHYTHMLTNLIQKGWYFTLLK